MVRLSTNLNRIALLRNSREIGIPNVLKFARICLQAGSDGLTVHPRPDERHIRRSDVPELAQLIRDEAPGRAEFNIEGNPQPEFMKLVLSVRPDQCTLVPDNPHQLTSDHGWDLAQYGEWVEPIIAELKRAGIRVSLFMDADDPKVLKLAKEAGADRAELYTGPYAMAYHTPQRDEVMARYTACAEEAVHLGLGLNAGHDLNLENLTFFKERMPGLQEVSIGHALTAEALELGMAETIHCYQQILA
ncbi:pyridoxine 5'-phosphate synthase [Candidatus Sumerlaeota bacterium]|nr:pyridoxine 5'-phosphate synthase [Candidatus Sumerlaeota bacterium]